VTAPAGALLTVFRSSKELPMTMTRTTFFSLGAFTALGLLLLAQTVNSVGLDAAALGLEAPTSASLETAMADDPAATALDDLAAWPVAATR